VVLKRVLPNFVSGTPLGDLASLAIFLAVVALAGKVLYQLVELPARNYLRTTWINAGSTRPAVT
jgi:hypothetical protein